MKRKAAFLDRDGVLVHDSGYVHRIEDLSFLPGVVAALRLLRDDGYRLVVVTNQSGIARGRYTEEDYLAFTTEMRKRLAQEGIVLDAVYHCPHLVDAQVPRYAMACDCRKPGPGMLLRALAELEIDPKASFIVGDRRSDLQAGRAAGLGACHLLAGMEDFKAPPPEADAVHDNLLACARAICTGHTQPCEPLS
jgi:D-glycero-D-manno-heptose 1,7-bisphosphate phosphatase